MTENFDRLRDLVSPITGRFVQENHTLFLVGGVVRDVLMNQNIESPDLDLTTNATPDQIRALVEPVADAVWLQGERFGTIGLRIGEIRMEITTHRSESYATSSRKPSVTFSSGEPASFFAPVSTLIPGIDPKLLISSGIVFPDEVFCFIVSS